MWRPRRSKRDGSTAHATTETPPVEPGVPLRPALAGRRLPRGPATERARARPWPTAPRVETPLRPLPRGRKPVVRDVVLRGRGVLGRRGRSARGGGREPARRGPGACCAGCRVQELAPERLGRRGLDG